MKNHLDQCPCGSKKLAVAMFDGHGIFLTYACDQCRKQKIARFRPDIFERYATDEQIEDE